MAEKERQDRGQEGKIRGHKVAEKQKTKMEPNEKEEKWGQRHLRDFLPPIEVGFSEEKM